MKQRRDIDGLRCLAIVPVVLCHAGLSYFSGGFVGVDCLTTAENRVLYSDNHHLSVFGAEVFLGGALKQRLESDDVSARVD